MTRARITRGRNSWLSNFHSALPRVGEFIEMKLTSGDLVDNIVLEVERVLHHRTPGDVDVTLECKEIA